METRNDIATLAYELTYHRYLMNKGKARNLFVDLEISEYIALHSIARVASDKKDLSQKTYLSDLAEQLEMSIFGVSKMITRLKERGLVLWSHDGDGSDGTYVVITESGINAMSRQEEVLGDYYSRVIDKFGHDNLIQLLQQMEKLEEIMDTEFMVKE